MEVVLSACRRLSVCMNAVGGTVLFLMMMLTVTDVILRFFGRPITGTYELVAVAGAIVVGFAIPQTSQDKAHICVDFLIENRAETVRKTFYVFTRVLGVLLFALLAWHLFLKGNHLYRSGDVSMTLHLPYYPPAFALAFCCLAECVVLMVDCIMAFDRGNQHE
jgi:TRAP-type C4-dicarboxylate transport system permease small subunit